MDRREIALRVVTEQLALFGSLWSERTSVMGVGKEPRTLLKFGNPSG